MLPYTSFFCSMSNTWFFELVSLLPFVCCFGISHCTVEGGLPFREVYFGRLQDERSQPVLRDLDSKKFSNPLYIQLFQLFHCQSCFCICILVGRRYVPICANTGHLSISARGFPLQSNTVSKVPSQPKYKKKNSWVGLLFTHHYDIPALGPGVSIPEKSELNKQMFRRFNYTWHPQNILQNVLKKTQNSLHIHICSY